MHKYELLAPAGNLEKLKFAIHYGADAVYMAGKKYGLRAFAGNFAEDELASGIKYAHEHNVKVYVTVNIFPHNQDLIGLKEYLEELYQLGADAIIAADPGVIMLAHETVPQLPIHISTQANTTNWADVKFWQKYLQVERVVLARELSLAEIAEIKEKTGIQIETFVHGAMCISYSGRCLLSHYMADRDANKGECVQACRWNYALVEEKRPNEFYAIEEDERGSYVFNSQDMCLLPKLKDIMNGTIDSFKIEGRMKSLYYTATIVRAYRAVIDALNDGTEPDYAYWEGELEKVSHRPYCTGFYFGKPEKGALTLASSGYIKPYDFVGIVLDYDEENQMAVIEQRNHFKVGDVVEFFGPKYQQIQIKIEEMQDKYGNIITKAPNAQMIVKMKVPHRLYPLDLMRKKID